MDVADRPPRFALRTEAVGVVIPAHNHAATISKCIASIFEANSYSGWQNELWIVVVADACTDQTAKVARRTIGAFGEVLEVTAQSLRTAHRIGKSTLLDHFRHRPRHAVMLVSADADNRVPRDWIDMTKRRPVWPGAACSLGRLGECLDTIASCRVCLREAG
jgi:hypothetical protein